MSNSNRKNKDRGIAKNTNHINEKISRNIYKILLDNIQKRMSFFIQKLINYIEILKKDK